MNFLSHYYFDRNNQNAYEVLGTVLPDLIKNANKSWNIHPEKKTELFSTGAHQSILTGWRKHLEIDRCFHNSDFFKIHTREIRIRCGSIFEKSPVRPFFVAHIALELMLDSLLITAGEILPEKFYTKLEETDKSVIEEFLLLNGISEIKSFSNFFNEFNQTQYLKSYSDPGAIIYAVNRICMRVWPGGFNETQRTQLAAVLLEYHTELAKDFISIFTYVEACLENNAA